MLNYPWTPWHQVVELRPDLKSGELPLALFAADLYDVIVQKGQRLVYEDPAEFFALTYPTFNLRELAKDVILRLAGKNDKAVRQLALTYGGGKTHALITLYHLVKDPKKLPSLPAVREFIEHIGIEPPRARVASLTFDHLDPVTGMDTPGPDGQIMRLRYPWSVMAYQLAGKEGLQVIGCDLKSEREEPPFTNVLEDLLRIPLKDGLAVLVLLDEVLMWARTKAEADPAWRNRLETFFQCLTQAASKVERCAVVASLLASDPRKSDAYGKELAQEIENIFRREQEPTIEPVVKEDVAEVLRRRFFTPESIQDQQTFLPHVMAALHGINELDDSTRKAGKAAEERYLKSYPFHPDLTEIFYTKWTALEGFQRTRGILRTFALALRDALSWDNAPLISTNVFIGAPGSAVSDITPISEAARELTTIAMAEEFQGRRQAWPAILQSEMEKALAIQADFPALRGREIEAAVFATFLHSQPIGQKALSRELMRLIGHTRPDKIELEKALRLWADRSWFLDDAFTQEGETMPDGSKPLPKSWRLGSRPNLTQMHWDACQTRVSEELVESRLLEEIGKLKGLSTGVSGAGVKVHNLPEWPKQIENDEDFHYVILGPKAASIPGKPSPEAQRFINETTAPDRPRVYRNAILLVVPSVEGLEVARNRIRDYLGWEEVRDQLKGQQIDYLREQLLTTSLEKSRKQIPEAVRLAYNIVVTISEKNEIQALHITPSNEPLFITIKRDSRVRIQETAISADALLPEGPYNLWRPGETSRRLKDLVTAFAQFPHLPKMLNHQAILDTLLDGCQQGMFVLRLPRPDRSFRTFWRQVTDEAALKEPALEVVLPEEAVLSDLAPELLRPNVLPGLWIGSEVKVQEIYDYFSSGKTVKIQKEGYEEPVVIPKAPTNSIDIAIGAAVKNGWLWLVSGPASFCGEEIPAGLLMPETLLSGPPPYLSTMDVLPERLPDAWKEDTTTALAITVALSGNVGKPMPWKVVRDALSGAFNSHYLVRTVDSAPWPCDYGGAQWIKVQIAKEAPPPPPPPPPPPSGTLVAEGDLQPGQIQDLADSMGELLKAAEGNELRFRLRIELGGKDSLAQQVIEKINDILRSISDEILFRGRG
jgi:hypothetical protein